MSNNQKQSTRLLMSQYTRTTTIKKFRIINQISESEEYKDLFHALDTSNAEDEIIICLNSPGGLVYPAIEIIHAMKQSKATITTSIEGNASSAAALIFLSGTKFIVNEFSTMMIHSMNSGAYGKVHELGQYATYLTEHNSDVINRICFPFLSKAEIKSVLNGEDFYLNATEIKKRIAKINK